MPTYDYVCKDCGHEFEAFQSMKEDPLTECPSCHGSVKRLVGGGTGIGVGFGALLAAVALATLVLEIDVDAGGEGIAAEDVAGRPLRLDRAQQAEIVLRMLLIAFAQHPVAGGQRVARQLLVLLEHVLRGAADLDPVRAVRFERAVGIVLRLAASAAAAAAAPVAAALPLHTLEISHVIQWLWPAPKVAPQEMSYGPCRLGSGRMGPG